MNAHIEGMGWVTPLGVGLDEVWQRIKQGERAEVREIANPHSQRAHFYIPVPPKFADTASRNPRLRRSSAISCFAATAGLAALENAGIKMSPEVAASTALILPSRAAA